MTQYPDLFAALAAPFDASEVKARTQAGRQMHYITARTAMNRLDGVLGPENWWDEYAPAAESVGCRLTIRLPDGQELTKADAGGYAGMADAGDDDKSGFSDAFKRAAVKFGIGRYLYGDGVPELGADDAPAAPPPVTRPEPAPAAPQGQRDQPRSQGSNQAVPKTGGGLYAWAKEQGQAAGKDVVKYLQSWGKLQDFPQLMKDWTSDQVALGHAEACRKLQSVGN